MLSMVSGSVGFAPEPARRPDLRLRAAPPAGGDDRRRRRGRSRVQPFGPDDLRVRRGAAVLELRPLARRLGGQAAAEEVRDPRLMAAAATPRAAPARAERRVDESLRTWRWSDRLALRAVLGRRASRCARSPARSSLYMAGQGPAVPAASTCSSARPQAAADQTQDRRLPGPDHRHAPAHRHRHRHRGAARGRHRGLARRVRPPAWLARVVESGIEIVAGTPDIVIAIFGLVALPARHLRVRCRSPRRAARSSAARS